MYTLNAYQMKLLYALLDSGINGKKFETIEELLEELLYEAIWK